MIEIHVDKLYRYPRIREPLAIGIPVKQGELTDIDEVAVYQDGKPLPLQKKITSRHQDGSVRFMFLRFLADLPANKGVVLQCDYHAEADRSGECIQVTADEKQITVDTGAASFCVEHDSDCIFAWLEAEG